MKKISLLLSSVLLLGIYSCSKKNKSDLVFSNDIDSQCGWNSKALVIKGTAHSGNYYTKVDSSIIYSDGFLAPIADISNKKFKGVKANVWALFKNMNADAKLVVSVEKNGQPLAWNASPLKNSIKNPDQWTSIACVVNIPAEADLSSAYVKVFVWNLSKETILIDDFEVEFVE